MRLFSLQRSYDALATGIEPLKPKVTPFCLGLESGPVSISTVKSSFRRTSQSSSASSRGTALAIGGMQLRSASYAWPESGFSWRDAFPVLVSDGTELCR